jgi:hypothetical protein
MVIAIDFKGFYRGVRNAANVAVLFAIQQHVGMGFYDPFWGVRDWKS